MNIMRIAVSCALVAGSAAGGQQVSSRGEAGNPMMQNQVKTLPLHHLSNSDAVLLLTPYVTGNGTVYPLGSSIHAVTVRGNAAAIADAERVLAQYDRSPTTVSLSFQLIGADNTTRRDASLAGIDSVLRGVLRFTGYHLLTVAMVNISEGANASQILTADGQDYRLSYEVTDISGTSADATVHVQVSLARTGVISNGRVPAILLSTGVTIPIGHTVVLGSSADGASSSGETRALILTVRPQPASAGKPD